MMRRVTLIIPLFFVVRARAEEWVAQHTDDAQDSMNILVDRLIDRLFNNLSTYRSDQMQEAAHFFPADLDGSTLGKSGSVASHVPPSISLYTKPMYNQLYNPLLSAKPSRFSPPRHDTSLRSPVAVSANLFDRFKRVVKGNLNKMIESAEDPEKMIDQVVNEMNTDLVRLKQETAKYMGTLKQAEAKYNTQQAEADQWMKRAELALSKNDEELAREALKRKKTAEDLANNYKVQVDNTKGAVDQLVANVRLIEQKVQDAKAKKSTLQARAATARSSKQIQELVSGIDTGKSALGAFDKMEQKVLSMEAENEAVAQLKAPEASMEDKFKQLEAGSSVDDELAAMKRNLLPEGKSKAGSSSGAKQERSAKDAIDVELEALRKKAQEKA